MNLMEQCDLGPANSNTGMCTLTCKAAVCGDKFVQAGVEQCDDGNMVNNDGCSATCKLELMGCGNGQINQGERCDPGLPPPFTGVGCKPGTCTFDFSQVPQLYCNGGCSWAGAQDCDQADADIYCKLKQGNPNSTATNFQVTTAQPTFGFSCPLGGYGSNLGPLPEYGVAVNVWYQQTSILANHGPGNVIVNPTCTNP